MLLPLILCSEHHFILLFAREVDNLDKRIYRNLLVTAQRDVGFILLGTLLEGCVLNLQRRSHLAYCSVLILTVDDVTKPKTWENGSNKTFSCYEVRELIQKKAEESIEEFQA